MSLRGHHICLLGLMLISYGFINNVRCFCLFDEVQPDIEPKHKTNIRTYGGNDQFTTSKEIGKRSRRRRAVPLDSYQSIRINVQYHDLDQELSDKQQLLLKQMLEKTVSKAKKIFSVKPVEGPLILSRSDEACFIIYKYGPNAGKCADVRNGYRGELCSDEFSIPDEHLEGLKVYSENSSEPIRVVKEEGSGLPETDFVLYVRSLSTDTCLHSTLQTVAYATYCDLNDDYRPLAGYINFCPSLLSKQNYDKERLYFIALHELFHALGFSNKLYDKFWECDNLDNCYFRKDTVRTVLGEQRLVTPKVVELATKHFGCSTHDSANEFGPMLETKEGENKVYSHWDGAFMFSSIMTPKIGLPAETLIDVMTLAVFEDTGWYKVDYSQADYFPWGDGGGCNWGRHPQCLDTAMDDESFCHDIKKQGCHYLHFGKGVCNTDDFLHGCSVYKATEEDACSDIANSPDDSLLTVTGEMYGKESCCFTANLTTENYDWSSVENGLIKGRCYHTRCIDNIVELKIGSSPWIVCPDDGSITVPGYSGILECPHTKIICKPKPTTSGPWIKPTRMPRTMPLSTVFLTLHNGTAPITSPLPILEDLVVICIDIKFRSLQYEYLVNSNLETAFKDACLFKLIQVTGVARRRVNNIFVIKGSAVFRFDLLPARYGGDGPRTNNVVNRLRLIIANANFTITLSPGGTLYAANDFQFMEGGPTLSMDDTPKGVIAGVVIGSFIAAAIIGIAVFFVQRYYTVHSRNVQNVQRTTHPRRSSLDSQRTNRSRSSGVNATPQHNNSITSELQQDLTEQQRNAVNMSFVANESVPDVVVMRQTSPERTNVYIGESNHPFIDGRQRTTTENHVRMMDENSSRSEIFQTHISTSGRASTRSPNSTVISINSGNTIGNNTFITAERPSVQNETPFHQDRNDTSNNEDIPLRQPKSCALKCKCAWLKKKLKGRNNSSNNLTAQSRTGDNNREQNVHQFESSENNKEGTSYRLEPQLGVSYIDHYSNPAFSLNNEEFMYVTPPRYPTSVIHCSSSPNRVRRDHNANVYPPHYVSLEDVTSDFDHLKNRASNPAPSVNTSHNSSEDVDSSKSGTYLSKSSADAPLSHAIIDKRPSYHENTDHSSCGELSNQNPELHQCNRAENPIKISHRSSCKSFEDSTDNLPMYRTNIEIKKTASVDFVKGTGQSGSTSNVIHTSGSSTVDLSGSQSTIDTTKGSESAFTSTAASDTDISYLAKSVDLVSSGKGNRCSTTSWQSFSSEASLGSSVLQSKN